MLGRRLDPEPLRTAGVRVCAVVSARRITPDPGAADVATTPSGSDRAPLSCARAATGTRTINARNTTRFIIRPPRRELSSALPARSALVEFSLQLLRGGRQPPAFRLGHIRQHSRQVVERALRLGPRAGLDDPADHIDVHTDGTGQKLAISFCDGPSVREPRQVYQKIGEPF